MIELIQNQESNEKNSQQIDDNQAKEKFNFDQFLQQKVGFGKAQLYSMIGCSCTVMADGAEMMVIGLILPAIKLQMGLTDGETDLLTSMIFVGFGIGAFISGILADKHGRRNPYILATLGQCISAFLSAIPANYGYFVIMRTIFGFCCGITFSINPTYTSEILPKSVRGKYYCIMTITFTLGELITVVMGYFCMDSLTTGNWRALLLWSALPTGISCLICYLKMLESARYLLICNDAEQNKGIDILKLMLEINGKPVDVDSEEITQWAITESQRQKNISRSGDIKNLFTNNKLFTTLKLMIVWFSLSFVFYGINFSLSTVVHKIRQEKNSNDSEAEMKQQKNIDYTGIFFTVLLEMPSSIIAAFIIETKEFGRKVTLIYCYLICAISCLITYLSQNSHDAFYFSVTVSQFFINISFIIIFPFTTELYSTIMRATALGFHSAICRIGGILMPWIVLLFFNFGATGPFLAFSLISLISGAASFFLPQDKVNSNLDGNSDKDGVIKTNEDEIPDKKEPKQT